MEDCIFCKIIKGEIPSFKIYENDKVFAFADINPVTVGHTLIIPKNHSDNLWEISDDDLTAVQLASKMIIKALKETLNPIGVAALQLNGRGANQVVMHYHLHLVPRGPNEPQLPMNWEPEEGDMDIIQTTAEKIRSAIKE
ncbi:HIT family protein [Thermodesulfobacteriota bacterium]